MSTWWIWGISVSLSHSCALKGKWGRSGGGARKADTSEQLFQWHSNSRQRGIGWNVSSSKPPKTAESLCIHSRGSCHLSLRTCHQSTQTKTTVLNFIDVTFKDTVWWADLCGLKVFYLKTGSNGLSFQCSTGPSPALVQVVPTQAWPNLSTLRLCHRCEWESQLPRLLGIRRIGSLAPTPKLSPSTDTELSAERNYDFPH